MTMLMLMGRVYFRYTHLANTIISNTATSSTELDLRRRYSSSLSLRRGGNSSTNHQSELDRRWSRWVTDSMTDITTAR